MRAAPRLALAAGAVLDTYIHTGLRCIGFHTTERSLDHQPVSLLVARGLQHRRCRLRLARVVIDPVGFVRQFPQPREAGQVLLATFALQLTHNRTYAHTQRQREALNIFPVVGTDRCFVPSIRKKKRFQTVLPSHAFLLVPVESD